ncbi:hypothetical protein F5B20DRAFT_582306 [Whalleya microplaca]|nr:hypothetical protein F5B20DRAFT_582306 [Whalleya microplaca]
MDEEAQRLFNARAVKRTPEEHAALERALARRRAERRAADHVRNPDRVQTGRVQRHNNIVSDITRNIREAYELDRHHRSVQRNLDEGDWSAHIYNGGGRQEEERCAANFGTAYTDVLAATELADDLNAAYRQYRDEQRRVNRDKVWIDEFEYAMFRMRSIVDGSELSPATLLKIASLPERESPVRLSNRTVRGAGWHRRGYRDNGGMWINVKHGCVRGQDVDENSTLISFVKNVFVAWVGKVLKTDDVLT